MTRDHLAADEFGLTQEFLAEMLGVRRAGVNSVARRLRQAGLIRYVRGRAPFTTEVGSKLSPASATAPSGASSSACSVPGAASATYRPGSSTFEGAETPGVSHGEEAPDLHSGDWKH
jgi:hypothetical protein